MRDKSRIFNLEGEYDAARQRLIDAANADPPVSAERFLTLQENAYRAWVKLEDAKRSPVVKAA